MSGKAKKSMKSSKTLVPQSSPSVKKEIKRIIDANRKAIDISESDIPYISSFYASLLSEQGDDNGEAIVTGDASNPQGMAPADFTPERNAQDLEASHAPETQPETFETEGIPAEVTEQSLEQIRTWAEKLDEFANFLNDPDKSTSLHRILADSDKAGSLLRGVTRKATDSITRIAGEIEKLKEVLNSFIITAPKKQRDAAQTTGPLG